MDRRKAGQVLQEILNSWKEKTPIQGYYINGTHSDDDCQIRLIPQQKKNAWIA